MSSARILRRVVQATERVCLGTAPFVVDKQEPASRAAAEFDERDRVLEEHARRISELETQLAEAQRERELLAAKLSSTREQLASAMDAAQKQGYSDGLAKAQSEAQRELAQHIADWTSSVDHTARQHEARVQALQNELMEVVMTALAKLLGDHVVNPASIRGAIEQLFKDAAISPPARVLIAPTQHDQLVRFGAAHLAALRERRIEVAADPRITAGGCLIETPNGLIDGRFEVQLAKLKEIVAAHYASGSAAR